MATPLKRPLSTLLSKSPTDVVLLTSLRTPLTRAKKGGLKDAYPEELLATVLRATLAANPDLDPSRIDDICVGTVLQELGGAKAGRMAALHAGVPNTAAFHTVNRQCGSSLAAIAAIAHAIAAGSTSVGIAAGMESMTRNYYGSRAIPAVLWPALRHSPNRDARDCVMPMGRTSENVAARYGVSRADQDAFALRSHRRAAAARARGDFDAEIVPVTTRWRDPEQPDGGPERAITVSQDDGIRADATLDGLAQLPPAFAADGSGTAGNSSQVTDGAAATLLMRRSTATALGLSTSITGKWAGTQVAGCAPDEMGVGPALAIPKLLAHVGLTSGDVDRWEINEAFASQALHCVRKLGLEEEEEERVNVNGGAIALGHPIGATGARMVAGLMAELGRRGGGVGVVSMCVGTGMGMAGVFVRE